MNRREMEGRKGGREDRRKKERERKEGKLIAWLIARWPQAPTTKWPSADSTVCTIVTGVCSVDLCSPSPHSPPLCVSGSSWAWRSP